MKPHDAELLEDQFSSLLASYDEALAQGQAPPTAPTADSTLPEQVQQRLQQAQVCLDLLERVWPRSSARTLPFQPELAPAPAASDPGTIAPHRLGRFQILRELGRGGYGIVYLAIDTRLGRDVALKIPRPEALLNPELRRRFLREAEAAAVLDHPNIVPVFETGEEGPICYIVSAYCPGASLAKWLQRQQELVVPSAAAQLVACLADAVQHAHDHGILHRDIKPGNIMVTAVPESQPRLTDFGLAKLQTDVSETGSGVSVGTPSYMAPEQANSKGLTLGPGVDVYGLGAMLYELLAGRPPFKAATPLDTMFQVINDEPVAPRQLQPKVPRDLETICLYCLRKGPKKRYATAAALGADLRRFLAGTPIQARPMPLWEKGLRWAKHSPAAAALVLMTVLTLVGLSLATMLLTAANQREHQAKQDALEAQQLAQENERHAIQARLLAEEKEKEALRQKEDARQKGATAHAVAQFLVRLFQASDPFGLEGMGFRSGRVKGSQLTARELLDVGAKKVKTELANQPVVQAAMLDNLGNVHRSLGLFEQAQPLLEEGLALRRKHLGNEHEDTATSLHHLAWLYQDQGNYRDSEILYRQALAIRDKRFGKDNLESAKTMFNLAWLLGHQFDANAFEQPPAARLDEAEHLFRQALRIRQEKLGNHRDVGWTMAALATLMLRRNQTEAMALAFQALTILEQADKKEGAGSTFVNYLFAMQARQAGQLDEAEKQYRKILAQATELLGDEHPIVALLLGDMAGLLRKKGDLPEAEKAIRRALEIARRSALRHHPVMIEALLALGDYERDRGKIAEAENLFREAFALAQRVDRPKLTEATRTRLVELLRRQNRHADADGLAKPMP